MSPTSVVPRSRNEGSGPGDPWLLPALWMLAIVALASAARLLWWYWPGRVFDGVTSHIWTALASASACSRSAMPRGTRWKMKLL